MRAWAKIAWMSVPVLFLVLVAGHARWTRIPQGKPLPHLDRPLPRLAPADMYLFTTIVYISDGQQNRATATAFFFESSGRLFLATNRHVVAPNDGFTPVELGVHLHTNPGDSRQNQNYSVPLVSPTGIPMWHGYPGDDKVDVALVEVSKGMFSGAVYKTVSAADFLPEGEYLPAGTDLMIFGYPLGLFDGYNNLPVVRKGMIASLYGARVDGRPMFLGDAVIHHGMSGGPVFTKPENMHQRYGGSLDIDTVPRSHFLGINSAVVNDPTKTEETSMGLCFIWYAKLLEDIANSVH